MPLTALIGLINTISTIGLALFVFFKNPLVKTNRAYFFFGLSVGLYSAGYFFWGISKTTGDALLAFKILTTGIILTNSGYLEFVFNLIGVRKQKKGILFATHFLNALFALSVWGEVLFKTVGPKNIWGYWPYPEPLFYVYFLIWLCQIVYGLFALRKGCLQAPSRQAVQLRYVFYSTLIGFAGGGSNWLPWFGINFPPYPNALVSVYIGILAFAIVRHRLMEIQTAITRTSIFVLVYCIVLGIPAVLVLQCRYVLENLLGGNWWLLPGGLFAVLSFSGPFIYLILQRKAESLLLKEQKAYQQTLLQASRGMTLIKDLNRLLKLIVHILTKTVRITHARIFLCDSGSKQFICKAARGDHHKQGSDVISETAALIQRIQETKNPLFLEEIRVQGSADLKLPDEVIREMEKLDAAVIVPSFVQDRLLGFVVLGDKKSKRLYTESDLDTLTTLANQAALAIENCIFLTEFEQQQAHFFQAAKMADLGTMAAGIAHQINNRFCVIKLGVESAQLKEIKKLTKFFKEHDFKNEQEIVETLAKLCDRVAKSSDHGSEIVRRLLSFSRLSEGFRPVLIRELATSCIRLWECKRSLSEIDFLEEIPDGLPKVHGNFSELEEILFNLLDNAFDAITMKHEAWTLGTLEKPVSPEKGRIALSAKEAFRNKKRCVEIIVTDNGLGMSEADKQKVFVPFFTTKATAVKGTGLGLYVIRKMVDAHHGDIELESVRGQGTTFRIFIPVVAEA